MHIERMHQERRRGMLVTVAVLACICACDVGGPASGGGAATNSDSSSRPNGSDSAAVSTSHTTLLIPAHAGFDRVRELARDPNREAITADTNVARMVRRGYAIMRETKANAAGYVGNDLSCGNCHLNVGQKEAAWPLVGVATLFPQYRARTGRLITLDDRIRDCFVRSMNGSAPPFGSDEILAVNAYITWLSSGLPAGRDPEWRGVNEIARTNRIAMDKLNVESGRAAFERNCVACHGADGGGIDLGGVKPGPLWGARSWNDGAGAARIYTLAGFIRHAMPLTAPGSLNDADAQNIAAYINSKDRPRYANKAADYPDGKIPVDAVYYRK